MKKIFEVALRDYLATVKTKTFLISLLILPVRIAVGMIVWSFSIQAEEE